MVTVTTRGPHPKNNIYTVYTHYIHICMSDINVIQWAIAESKGSQQLLSVGTNRYYVKYGAPCTYIFIYRINIYIDRHTHIFSRCIFKVLTCKSWWMLKCSHFPWLVHWNFRFEVRCEWKASALLSSKCVNCAGCPKKTTRFLAEQWQKRMGCIDIFWTSTSIQV